MGLIILHDCNDCRHQNKCQKKQNTSTNCTQFEYECVVCTRKDCINCDLY